MQVTTFDPKPSPPIQLVRAVRDAQMTSGELLDLADALRDAPADASPRAVAEHAPAATKFVGIASKLGDHWVELLIIIVTLMAGYVAHQDADRAHRDAVEAHQDAIDAHQDSSQATSDAERMHRDADRAHEDALADTGKLSDEDLRKIAEQIGRLRSTH